MKRIAFIIMVFCSMMCMSLKAQDHGHDYCATDDQVRAVIDLVKHSSFDDDKYKAATVCLQLRDMDTEAIYQIAKCFLFDDNRMKFLKFAIWHCADVDYYDTLQDAFSFSSQQKEFLDFVHQFHHDHPLYR